MFNNKNSYMFPEKKSKWKLIVGIIVAILLVAVVSVFGAYKYMISPVNKHHTKNVLVRIPQGSSTVKIANIFKEKNLIRNPQIFAIYVKLHHENLKAGFYKFNQSQSIPTIIDHLSKGGKYQVAAKSVMIPEGSQLKEIASIIAKDFNMNSVDILKQLNDPTFIKGLQKKYPTLLTNDIFKPGIRYPLEGYLYPSTYFYSHDHPSLEEIVTPMLTETQKELTEYEAVMKEKKITPHTVLTMGSLIEEEATAFSDRALISSVFYNRLKAGMPLQTDPTVLYALGQHKSKVLYQDLKVKSPYNTYLNKGMPIGPIASPGKESVKAALYPAKSDYLYFLANKEGKVIFTKTLQQHNTEKAKFIK
ncbi:endolytic transglycosylase MltG [Gottfriedia endophytica]|nr:endolytic transglycosylase MltG [Gottfriedia endophytica]